MEFALYGLTFSIIILFVYRVGVSDGARNNVKSPIKVVKDVVSDVVNHKEIKEKTDTDIEREKASKALMNLSHESLLKSIQNEVNNID